MTKQKILIISLIAVALLAFVAIIAGLFGGFLTGQVFKENQTTEHAIGGVLKSDKLTPGSHVLSIEGATESGLSATASVSFTVPGSPNQPY